MSSVEWAIVHISDLHFGALAERERTPAWRNVLGISEHSYALLLELWKTVREILKEIPGPLVVVSGDQTTSANPHALQLVAEFLKDTIYVGPGQHVGLRLEEAGIIVPGNHDMFIKSLVGSRNRSDVYTRFFPTPKVCYEIKRTPFGSAVFFLVDSNRVEGTWKKPWTWNPYNIANAHGRGQVGRMQLDGLEESAETLRASTDFDYDQSLKVAVMHHHVVRDPLDAFGGSTTVIDGTDVLKTFEDIGIDLILCGHQHRSFRREIPSPRGVMRLSCAGSATKEYEWMNSFVVYRFRDHASAPSVTEYFANSRAGILKFSTPGPVPF